MRHLQLILAIWLTITSVIPVSCLPMLLQQNSSVVSGDGVSSMSPTSTSACCCSDAVKTQQRMACCAEPSTAHDAKILSASHRSQPTLKGCHCAVAPQSPTRGPNQDKTRPQSAEPLPVALPTLTPAFTETVDLSVAWSSTVPYQCVALSSLSPRAPPVLA